MIGSKTGTGGSSGSDVPPQPAAAALLPAAVGAALELCAPAAVDARRLVVCRVVSMTTHQSTLEENKSELIDKAIDLAQAGKGTGGPPHDAGRRARSRPTTATSRPRTSSTAPTSTCTARSRPLQARRQPPAGHRPGPGLSRPRSPSTAGRPAGTRRRGRHRRHAVPRRLGDDGAVPAAARRARGHPPAASTWCATSPARCSRCARCRTARLEPEGEAVRESWMHVEIDRLPEDEDPDAIVEDIQRGAPRRPRGRRGLAARCTPRSTRSSTTCAATRRRSPRGDRAGRRAARVAGRRPLHLPRLPRVPLEERDGDDDPARGPRAPASASCAPTRTCRRRSASCPTLVKAKAREKTLLVLAKANSRATVHRPAYLDYVGVKTFDENGEVVGERRFLGLFSSAAYTESPDADPADPREGQGGAQAQRLRPAQPRRQGADGHPRDLPARRAVPHPGRRARADRRGRDERPRAARSCGCSSAATPTAATSRCLVYLPRDRYNTGVRERFERILQEQLGGESIEFTARVSESTTARVHFVVHLPKGDADPRRRHRRPRAPPRRGVPLLARRLHPRP